MENSVRQGKLHCGKHVQHSPLINNMNENDDNSNVGDKKCHASGNIGNIENTATALTIGKSKGMVTIKRERLDDEIKEYAETAMNELLGWYGYSNSNNSKDISKKTSIRADVQHYDEDSLEITDKERMEDKIRSQLQLNKEANPFEMRKSSGNSSGSESPKSAEICGWCGKSVDDTSGLSSNNAVFCSELCFSQSRRANFKKNKTCDWCKHVRHTVSYVDFQDGASQLQFCSDKCLNQYKMHIFCRETSAHLEMHPHLLAEDTTSGLITPDLWMRNCKSPSSRTPSPVSTCQAPQTSPLPLITVAHPSKLLASPTHDKNTSAISHVRKKRLRKRSKNHLTEVAQDLRVRHSPNVNSYLDIPAASSNSATTSTVTNLPNGHHEFPELSSRLFAGPQNVGLNFGRFNGAGIIQSHPPIQMQPNLQQKHQVHGPSNSTQSPPEPASILGVPPIVPPNSGLQGMLPFGFPRANLIPPVTVMVPYPVMLPVPIPIPIPLPVTAFLQAAKLSKTSQNGNCNNTIINGEQEEKANEMRTEFSRASKNGANYETTSHLSDDEEIVVDDIRDPKQKEEDNIRKVGFVMTKAPRERNEAGALEIRATREFGDRKEGSSQNIVTCPIVPIQLRKRKRDVQTPNGKISNNVNYKHKKPLSV